jgi:hypothetical protein
MSKNVGVCAEKQSETKLIRMNDEREMNLHIWGVYGGAGEYPGLISAPQETR